MTFIVDGTNGLTFPNSTIQASGGKTIQVVQGTYSTQTSISTSTQTSTGLTASITPIFSTSKILVLISSLCSITGTGNIYCSPSLYRNSSAIYTSPIVSEFQLNSGIQLTTRFCLNYLDSPATTSSTSYTLYFNCSSGVFYAQLGGATSFITLIKIAA